jgi:hypothetical protein
MAPKDITAIAIKFFGIYLLVNVVLYFPVMIVSLAALEQYQEENFSSSVFISVVGSFVLLGVVVSYLLFRLANSIASRPTETTESGSQTSEEFLLQLLGIYFVVVALSAMPGMGISLFKPSVGDYTELLYGVGYLFQLSVGCYLLTKPVVWGQWLNRLRGRS